MAKGQAQEIYDIFGGMKAQPKPAAKEKEQSKVAYRKHTFSIREDVWQDFVILCRIDDKDNTEYINKLLYEAVSANREDIDYFRNRLNK